MGNELEELIDATIERVLLSTIEDIRSDLRFELDPKSIYAKTESVLYKYPLLQKAIQERKDQIVELQLYGIPQRSKSVTMFSGNSGYVDFKSDYEKKEDLIEQCQRSILDAKERLKPIDQALDSVKGSPYYKIIEMKYFNQKSLEKIANHFHCDVRTIQRNKNELLSKIKLHLFGEDVLEEMMGWLNC